MRLRAVFHGILFLLHLEVVFVIGERCLLEIHRSLLDVDSFRCCGGHRGCSAEAFEERRNSWIADAPGDDGVWWQDTTGGEEQDDVDNTCDEVSKLDDHQ